MCADCGYSVVLCVCLEFVFDSYVCTRSLLRGGAVLATVSEMMFHGCAVVFAGMFIPGCFAKLGDASAAAEVVRQVEASPDVTVAFTKCESVFS